MFLTRRTTFPILPLSLRQTTCSLARKSNVTDSATSDNVRSKCSVLLRAATHRLLNGCLSEMATIVFCTVAKTARITPRRCLISHGTRTAKVGELSSSYSSSHSPLLGLLPGTKWFSRGSSVRFMSHGNAGRSATGRSRRGVLAISGAAALTAGAAAVGFLANANHFQRAEMATKIPKTVEEKEEDGDILERCRGLMSLPVTDIRVLQERKGEMRTRMEMLIMETQSEFCKALQEVDGGTFLVDKWQRKEGEVGGSPCMVMTLNLCGANTDSF